MSQYFPELIPGKKYHVYTHAPSKESLFRNDEHYNYFLARYKFHINRVCKTYAWCLMPNHVHFLIDVKPIDEIIKDAVELSEMPYHPNRQLKTVSKIILLYSENNHDELNATVIKWISKSFGNLFSAYTQAYNRQQQRAGVLFRSTFNRKEVESGAYFNRLVHYIHYNPVKHHFAKTPQEWKYSSYNSILSDKKTDVLREQVLSGFEGVENFLRIHKIPPANYMDFE